MEACAQWAIPIGDSYVIPCRAPELPVGPEAPNWHRVWAPASGCRHDMSQPNPICFSLTPHTNILLLVLVQSRYYYFLLLVRAVKPYFLSEPSTESDVYQRSHRINSTAQLLEYLPLYVSCGHYLDV